MPDRPRPLGRQLTRQVLRLRDKDLLEGAMAAGALVALADQKVSIEESVMLQTVVANADQLQLYDKELALELYTRHVDRLRRDFTAGKRAALDAIGRCADDIDAAELMVHVGVAIAKADKVLAESELRMIDEICAHVGIEGLDTRGLTGVRPKRPN